MPDHGDVTRLLQELGHGGRAIDELLPLVYEDLRQIARRRLGGEAGGHTLQPTALVHEAYLKLSRLQRIEWKNRSQFFAIAARAMRRVLVDHAVSRRAAKRGGGRSRVPLEDGVFVSAEDAERLIDLNDALLRLESAQPRLARVVECRYFAGLSIEETAAALDTSAATVKRDWVLARAWLSRELAP
ncbi:MAG TPA: sigma-70 family RNA polymerase sigma factor [Vicinamibacteria bacterium]|nr:sigma-70 family RNA polymerase sigma factor [Vicinamibacteria bacterium]